MGSKIDEILNSRRAAPPAQEEDAAQGDKFFSVLLGEGMEEHFFEVRFRDGTKTCFPYQTLSWFNFSPEEGIDLDFDGYMICIKGKQISKAVWCGWRGWASFRACLDTPSCSAADWFVSSSPAA